MRIVTWNVNSVRARLPHVCDWLQRTRPDIVLLQELKCQEGDFPHEAIGDLGYNIAVSGQKTFNGVAILSKYPIEDLSIKLPTFTEDAQARYIEAFTGGVRVASVYVPNGQAVGSEKFLYKMTFLERLQEHLAQLLTYEEKIIVGGDYNIAPTDEDVADPASWRGHILCSNSERDHFHSLLHLGYYDAIRSRFEGPGPFTWWDYRSTAWARNEGLRIDHLLLSPQAMDSLSEGGIDREERGRERASDHAPVWITMNKEL